MMRLAITRIWTGARGLCAPRGCEVRREDVRLELSRLGILGRSFSIDDDLKFAVEKYTRLGKLTVERYPDRHQGVVFDNRLEEGVLADVSYSEDSNEAIILIRESLESRPWPTYELCLLHELSHLIGKHHLRYPHLQLHESTIRRSWTCPQTEQHRIEVEARQRAKLLLLAHVAPEAFEQAGADRVA
jgi:hypothetical protein